MDKTKEALYLATISMLMGMCMRLSQPQQTVLMLVAYICSGMIYMLAAYYFYEKNLRGATVTLFKKTIQFK